jgi:hypothetical protein
MDCRYLRVSAHRKPLARRTIRGLERKKVILSLNHVENKFKTIVASDHNVLSSDLVAVSFFFLLQKFFHQSLFFSLPNTTVDQESTQFYPQKNCMIFLQHHTAVELSTLIDLQVGLIPDFRSNHYFADVQSINGFHASWSDYSRAPRIENLQIYSALLLTRLRTIWTRV